MKEEETLIEISKIDCVENAKRYQDEFSSINNAYSFESYLNILERIKHLILKGHKDVEQNMSIIKRNVDNLL